jgi:hypothetical protein
MALALVLLAILQRLCWRLKAPSWHGLGRQLFELARICGHKNLANLFIMEKAGHGNAA